MNVGSTIAAAGYNSLLDKVRMVFGVGVGDRGYGQNLDARLMARDSRLDARPDLATIREMLQRCRRHQLGNGVGFSTTDLPVIEKGDIPYASVFTKYEQAADIILRDGLVYGNPSMSVMNEIWSMTRWSGWGPRQVIRAMFDVVWDTDHRSRWFFNSGGEIRLSFSHPNVWTPDGNNQRWALNLAAVGMIRYGAHGSNGNNSKGTLNRSIGFYETGQRTHLFNGENIDADYWPGGYGSVDDFHVYCSKIARGVRFEVTLHEANDRQLVSGTKITMGCQIARWYLTDPLIRQPTIITQASL